MKVILFEIFSGQNLCFSKTFLIIVHKFKITQDIKIHISDLLDLSNYLNIETQYNVTSSAFVSDGQRTTATSKYR